MPSPEIVFTAAAVSSNQKWLAAPIGLAAIVVFYIIAAVMNKSPNPLKLVDGSDGRPSISKFQWVVGTTDFELAPDQKQWLPQSGRDGAKAFVDTYDSSQYRNTFGRPLGGQH